MTEDDIVRGCGTNHTGWCPDEAAVLADRWRAVADELAKTLRESAVVETVPLHWSESLRSGWRRRQARRQEAIERALAHYEEAKRNG